MIRFLAAARFMLSERIIEHEICLCDRHELFILDFLFGLSAKQLRNCSFIVRLLDTYTSETLTFHDWVKKWLVHSSLFLWGAGHRWQSGAYLLLFASTVLKSKVSSVQLYVLALKNSVHSLIKCITKQAPWLQLYDVPLRDLRQSSKPN